MSAGDEKMSSTRVSLLSRVRDTTDVAAWREFEQLYRELLLRFCRRRGLQAVDADDVVQSVFLGMTTSLPKFVYDANRGRFRDYLFRCTRNAISAWAARRHGPGQPLDSRIPDPDEGGPADTPLWEEEWVAHHYRMAMQRVRASFDDRSVAIFDRSMQGATVAELAAAHQMSEQAVYKARQRIRERLEALIAEQVRHEDEVNVEGAAP